MIVSVLSWFRASNSFFIINLLLSTVAISLKYLFNVLVWQSQMCSLSSHTLSHSSSEHVPRASASSLTTSVGSIIPIKYTNTLQNVQITWFCWTLPPPLPHNGRSPHDPGPPALNVCLFWWNWKIELCFTTSPARKQILLTMFASTVSVSWMPTQNTWRSRKPACRGSRPAGRSRSTPASPSACSARHSS